MGRIKAIPTEYNGYIFRSRLEARWALFFDALGIRYEYEPEGFELPSGKRYLPDFRVKCYGTRGYRDAPKEISLGDLCHACKYGNDDSYAYQGDCKRADVAETGPNGICTSCRRFRLYDGDPFDLYIEVKGKMTQDDADRIIEFANIDAMRYMDGQGRLCIDEKRGNPTLIVGRIPDEGCAFDGYGSLGSYDPMNGIDIYPFSYWTIDGDYFAAYPAAHNGYFYLMGDDSNYINGDDVKPVNVAYRIARQAQFDHGLTPTRQEVQRRYAAEMR